MLYAPCSIRIIDELYLQNPSSGSWSISLQLRRQGKKVNRKRVQRLMRLMGIEAVYHKDNYVASNYDGWVRYQETPSSKGYGGR